MRATYRGDLAGLEGSVDAVQLKFAVDVGILLLEIGGLVDVGSHDCGACLVLRGMSSESECLELAGYSCYEKKTN